MRGVVGMRALSEFDFAGPSASYRTRKIALVET